VSQSTASAPLVPGFKASTDRFVTLSRNCRAPIGIS
jgi:hypothetical protein